MIVNRFHQKTLAKIVRNPIELAVNLKNTALGKRIVLVKGVYDLFHSGHYYSFVNAKMLGDVLVVGVNSDRAVKLRKERGRPIISEQERMILVAALNCVDWVTLYDDVSPINLIKEIRPHVFAASHFSFLSEAEKGEVKAFATLSVLPKEGDISTSQILRNIKSFIE